MVLTATPQAAMWKCVKIFIGLDLQIFKSVIRIEMVESFLQVILT